MCKIRGYYKGPRISDHQFFPSTLAASEHMGFTGDKVGREIRRSLRAGRATVSGVHFITAKQADINYKSGLFSFTKLMQKHFPFVFERKVQVAGFTPRTYVPPSPQPPPAPVRTVAPGPEPEYYI
jgi:hypothetical protein